MAVSATPVFAQSGQADCKQVSTANANVDGSTGSYSSAITIGANGAIIYGAFFQALVTTTAGALRVFYADDGSTYRLLGEVLQTAQAYVAGTTDLFSTSWTPPFGQFTAKAGSKFIFSSTNSELTNCHLFQGVL